MQVKDKTMRCNLHPKVAIHQRTLRPGKEVTVFRNRREYEELFAEAYSIATQKTEGEGGVDYG